MHVKIVTETIKERLLVPAAAILPGEEGGTAVLVIDSDSTAHRRAGATGRARGRQGADAERRVMPREEVVVVGGLGVDDKAKVKVVASQRTEADEDDSRKTTPPRRTPRTRRKTRRNRKRNERPFDPHTPGQWGQRRTGPRGTESRSSSSS